MSILSGGYLAMVAKKHGDVPMRRSVAGLYSRYRWRPVYFLSRAYTFSRCGLTSVHFHSSGFHSTVSMSTRYS